MAKTIENTFFDFVNLAVRDSEPKKNGLLSAQEINGLMAVLNPCLVIIKPHAVNRRNLVDLTEWLISGVGLGVLVDKPVGFTREQVFGIYGDLCEVMAQGDEGVAFVEGLASSFVDEGNRGRVMIVYGEDSYMKMRKIKKTLRGLGGEDRFRNVLHSSDDLSCAMGEINALLLGNNG